MRKRMIKPDQKAGNHIQGLTRRHFISSIITFSLLGLARPLLKPDKVYAEEDRSEYLFVNGWLISNDDYEKITDAR
jgi:hypothetical protein